jgi:hypothetical protein
MGWVAGALLLVIALAFIIAGGSGHAQNLFSIVFGKSTSGSSTTAQGSTVTPQQLTQDSIDDALASLTVTQPTSANASGGTTTPQNTATLL